MPPRNVCSVLGLSLLVAGTSSADVTFFVDNPAANSADYAAACAARSLALDSSLQFALHPLGPVIPAWFQASAGVVIDTDRGQTVQEGVGSLEGNLIDPGGIGEGLLLPEPARYLHTGSGGLAIVDFTFDAPVAGFGLMTADMYQWGAKTPNATLEAFDADGASLGAAPAFNASFEFDYLYFMGVVDDDARISRIRFTNYGVSGDSIYLTYGVIARAPTATCPADIAPAPGGDGTVDIDDLLAVINAWGPCAGCPADIAPTPGGNDIVDIDDLLAVINGWGACP